MRRRRRQSYAQQELPIFSEELEWFSCHRLFSGSYLKRHFSHDSAYPSAEEVRAVYQELKELWEDERRALARRNEAYTRTKFLEPVLSCLGWQFIPEESASARKRPDYCLFRDEESRRRAASQSDTAAVFREAATVLEAKKLHHPLDAVSKSEAPGRFPSQQIQDYLHPSVPMIGETTAVVILL